MSATPEATPASPAAQPPPVATAPQPATVSGRVVGTGLGVLSGAVALPRGLGTIVANPRLWPFAAAPIVIAAFAFGLGVALGAWLVHGWAAGWFTSWNGWFWGSIASVAELLLHLVVFVVAIVASKTVVLPIVAGPFNEMLSEQTEYILTGVTPPSTSFRDLLKDAMPAAYRGITTALFGIAVLIIFAPLLLIPGLGVVLYLVPTAYVEALAALDVTFARKKMTLTEKRAWLGGRRSGAIGLGLAIVVANLIPLGALAVVPAAAVAGTLLVVGPKGDKRS